MEDDYEPDPPYTVGEYSVQDIRLIDLMDEVKETRDVHKKYCIFFDNSENVATFFLYKGLLKEINKELIKLEAEKTTK